MCLLKCVNSEVQIRMIALYAAVSSKTLTDLLEEKIKEGVAIFAFRYVLFFSFFYRRCGSVKVVCLELQHGTE